MISKLTVKHLQQNNVVSDYIQLQDASDVFIYMEQLRIEIQKQMTRFLRSPMDQEEFSETVTGMASSTIRLIAARAKLECGNMIYYTDYALTDKLIQLSDLVLKKGGVLINPNGGFTFFHEGTHEIISEHPFSFSSVKSDYVFIPKGTQYINLENDPDLEAYTKEMLSKIDPNYSYVKNLREFNYEALVNIFSDFIKNGGHTVYVYTTGSDTAQMLEYARAAFDAGIKNIMFTFNAGLTEDIEKSVKHMKDIGLNVVMSAK